MASGEKGGENKINELNSLLNKQNELLDKQSSEFVSGFKAHLLSNILLAGEQVKDFIVPEGCRDYVKDLCKILDVECYFDGIGHSNYLLTTKEK